MKIVFLVNSPYHVMLSKAISNEIQKSITSTSSCLICLEELSMEKLNLADAFDYVLKYPQQIALSRGKSIKSLIKSINYNRRICNGISKFLDKNNVIFSNCNLFFTFTDDVIIHQKVIKYFKKVQKSKVILIDEGLVLYYSRKMRQIVKTLTYTLLGLGISQAIDYGNNKYVDLVMCNFPQYANTNKPTVKMMSLDYGCSNVLNIFDINTSVFEEEKKIIYIGTPMSEHNLMSIDEEINIVDNLAAICSQCGYKLYVKPHPREAIIKYNTVINDNVILIKNNQIPIELINSLYNFEVAISINSSSLINLAKQNIKCIYISNIINSYKLDKQIEKLALSIGCKFASSYNDIENIINEECSNNEIGENINYGGNFCKIDSIINRK